MNKEQKHKENHVGANCACPNFEGKTKTQKGITLIALVITIIVMLILVGVSVTVALNGGLFSTAKKARDNTLEERDRELAISNGDIINKHLNGGQISEGWTETTKPVTWTSENVTAITDGTNTIPLPNGFQVSSEEGENTVEGGLVITDGTNEFVWIPVAEDFDPSYRVGICSEPTTLSSYDTQNNLNKYYGTKADGSNYYTLGTDFLYSSHYNEMVTSVNKYKGFYIGRYETTVDDAGNIGSKANTTVLTSDAILKDGENANDSNNPFYYRWWGLYDAQRKANVAGNGSYVQTNMIWGQQWDAMITYFGSRDISASPVAALVTPGKQKSGEAKYTHNGVTISDEICNIYDLRGNTNDWTAEAHGSSSRVGGGGYCNSSDSVSNCHIVNPDSSYDCRGSRLTLYIK